MAFSLHIYRSNSNFLTVAAASALGVVGGSVVLAKVSDGYRKMSESYIPGSAFLYNLILGPQQQPMKIENKFEPKPKYATFCANYIKTFI